MQKIIYTGRFICKICKREILMPVYGNSTSTFTPEEELECIDWCRHFHWIDFHRVCAVCGKIVRSGELELAINDGTIEIHKEYTDEYEKIQQGNQFGHLLIIHENCMNK